MGFQFEIRHFEAYVALCRGKDLSGHAQLRLTTAA
jgi:hypothetical protein